MSRMTLIDRLRIPTYDNEAYATTGRVEIDQTKCNGCGMCATVCPGKALFVAGTGTEKKARMEAVFPQCMSCNDCAAMCERQAIKVTVTYDFGYFYKPLAKNGLTPPRRFDEGE